MDQELAERQLDVIKVLPSILKYMTQLTFCSNFDQQYLFNEKISTATSIIKSTLDLSYNSSIFLNICRKDE